MDSFEMSHIFDGGGDSDKQMEEEVKDLKKRQMFIFKTVKWISASIFCLLIIILCLLLILVSKFFTTGIDTGVI